MDLPESIDRIALPTPVVHPEYSSFSGREDLLAVTLTLVAVKP